MNTDSIYIVDDEIYENKKLKLQKTEELLISDDDDSDNDDRFCIVSKQQKSPIKEVSEVKTPKSYKESIANKSTCTSLYSAIGETKPAKNSYA
jgi:hypothetical protein